MKDEDDEREEGEELQPISREDMERIYKTQNQLLWPFNKHTRMPTRRSTHLDLFLYHQRRRTRRNEFTTSLRENKRCLIQEHPSAVYVSYAHNTPEIKKEGFLLQNSERALS